MSDDQRLNDMLRLIFSDGRVKPIKWQWDSEGEDAWSEARKLEYACDLASSMNQAADMLQKERDSLLEQIRVAEENLKNADDRMLIYRDTLHETITQHNADRQSDAAAILQLDQKVRQQAEIIQSHGD